MYVSFDQSNFALHTGPVEALSVYPISNVALEKPPGSVERPPPYKRQTEGVH